MYTTVIYIFPVEFLVVIASFPSGGESWEKWNGHPLCSCMCRCKPKSSVWIVWGGYLSQVVHSLMEKCVRRFLRYSFKKWGWSYKHLVGELGHFLYKLCTILMKGTKVQTLGAVACARVQDYACRMPVDWEPADVKLAHAPRTTRTPRSLAHVL